MKKTMFDFDSRREVREAFKAGNRARKKETVQDTVDSVYSIQEQIDLFKEQTGIELEIRDGHPYFDGNLDLDGCTGPTNLPAGLEVEGNLFLDGCTGLTSLPVGLKVGGHLRLDGCTGLTSLPAGLKVGEALWMTDCIGLTGLPFDLVVQGDWIIHKGILKSFFRKLRIPVDDEGDTEAKDWREWQRAHGYLKEAFRAGNRARKKETVQDTVESVDNIQEQIDIFEKQTGYELDIKDGRPYANWWGEGLVIRNCAELTSLPDGLITSFSLIIENCINLTSLPVGLTVGGKLYLENCPSLTSLPAGLTVSLGLSLENCPELTSLPVISNVKNYLIIENCPKLTSLPVVLNIKNSFDSGISITLRDCPELTSLPDGLIVEALTIEHCSKLTSLPQDLTVSWMTLENCTGLTSLPRGLTLRGLHLHGCTGLTSLPSDLTVNDSYIYGIPDSLRPFMERLGIKVNKKGDISTYHWMKKRHLANQVAEAFKAGNHARKKEAVQDAIESVDSIQAQIDRFEKQTGIELEIRDRCPYFDGDLDLEDCTGLTSLPVRLKVRGSLLLLSCTGLTSLPVDLKVGKDLWLRGCTGLTSLPDDLEVYGELNLSGCTGLTSLPDGLKVRGDLLLQGCTGLTSLPAGLEVEESLNIGNCTGLTSLPAGLKVGGDLELGYCTGLTSLPAGLEVNGYLRLGGCTGLTSLPDKLKIGGNLWAGDSGLTSLPFDLIIQGSWIMHKGILKSFFRKLRIPVSRDGNTKASDWHKWQEANGYLGEAFRAGNRARKKEAVQDSQTDNIDTIDNLEDLLDVCDKVVLLYSGREHQFPKGWVFGTDGSGVNPPEITESPVNDRQYLRNWLVKYRYDFNGSRIRSDLAKEIPGDENHKFDSNWDLIHSNGRATHLNFDYTVGVMKKKDEDGYRIVFNDGINEACIYMPGYSRSSFGMALMHLFGVTFMKKYIKAAYYQGVNDPLGDGNYKEAVQMIIHLFTEAVPMNWNPEQVISVEIGQEPVYTNNDFIK